MPKVNRNAHLLITGPLPESIKEARSSIVAILEANADTKAKIQGLKTLHHLCQVANTNISNCTFTGDL